MKRRQVITGFVGLASAAMVPSLHKQQQLNAQKLAIFDWSTDMDHLDPPGFDPSHDRERPVAIAEIDKTAVVDMDDRDAQTMTGQSSSAKVVAESAQQASEKTNQLATHTLAESTQKKPQAKTAATQKPNKSVDFARDYDDDIFVADADAAVFHSVFLRLKNLQKTIGFGHFNLVSFDEALAYGKRFSAIGEFTPAELDFVEKVFFTNASDYGFYGKKVTEQLTDPFKKSDAVKIPASGHYLFKNESLAYYDKLKKDVGNDIILTSGIRSNVKQLYLFLAKTVRVNGNLSRASRSLAPPGYSYHGIGDFDVGRIGWGAKNFTDDFANTDEFKRMRDLGYISIRYDHGNQLGVRFEPWHIKVV